VSISNLTSASLLDDSLSTGLTTGTKQTAAKNAGTLSGASTAKSAASADTSISSPDVLTQDVINLLKALAFGDLSGAKNDLAKFKTDLKSQTAPATPDNLVGDVTSLLKDLATGNSSAVRTDVTKLTADSQAQDTATTAGTRTLSPLESLVAKISDALSSGVVQGTVQELAGYLVQHGQAKGSLLNTSI
jgi:hypothetical protein